MPPPYDRPEAADDHARDGEKHGVMGHIGVAETRTEKMIL